MHDAFLSLSFLLHPQGCICLLYLVLPLHQRLSGPFKGLTALLAFNNRALEIELRKLFTAVLVQLYFGFEMKGNVVSQKNENIVYNIQKAHFVLINMFFGAFVLLGF